MQNHLSSLRSLIYFRSVDAFISADFFCYKNKPIRGWKNWLVILEEWQQETTQKSQPLPYFTRRGKMLPSRLFVINPIRKAFFKLISSRVVRASATETIV